MSSEAITFRNVTKSYDLSKGVFAVRKTLERWKNGQFFAGNLAEPISFAALRDVSFSIMAGERVGVIGANGAGKSTTLKLINRVTRPTSGQVEVRGSTGGLIELGAGFNPELTGRDNIYLNSAIYGWSSKQTSGVVGQIASLAELTDFLDVPVKKYSSGMRVRLAFAVAVAHSPDIVLLDEVLAVGDLRFREKCLAIVKDYLQGKTVVFVSHSFREIEQVCDRVLVFNHGALAFDGDLISGEEAYMNIVQGGVTGQPERIVPVNLRRGVSEIPPAKVARMHLESLSNSPEDNRFAKGEDIQVNIEVSAARAIAQGCAGRVHIVVKQALLGTLTETISGTVVSLTWGGEATQTLSVSFRTDCLRPATYQLESWVELDGQSELAQRQILATTFSIKESAKTGDVNLGVVDLGFQPVVTQGVPTAAPS